jgi:hypothetical protein
MLKHYWRSNIRVASRLVALVTIGLSLAGCGGSGGSHGTALSGSCASSADCGSLLVGLTDADGDFVSYSVDVLSLTLKRANGATVEMLPATTRIDFAQLTDLTDLLSVAALAPGDIVGGTIRLDYTNAEINVEVGGAIVPAKIVDADGNPLGVTDLQIELSNRDHLVITRGRAAFLSLDFDLAASNTVDVTQSPPVVTAQPVLIAEVAPVTQKQFRARGALSSVDTGSGTYTIEVRPWHHHDGDYGTMTVHTTDATTYEIDGTPYTGAPGLEALAGLDTGTVTVAFGTLDLTTHEFTAENVLAGTSVSGEGLDAIHGNVVSRNGDELTVKGGFVIGRDHMPHFRRIVVVTVGPDTVVRKIGSATDLDKDAISVGQNITALGTFTDAADPSTPATLDATTGFVRLEVTRLEGSVTQVQAGQLNMHLRAIDRLGPDMFDFSGTSMSGQNADPNDYEISTGTLTLSSLSVGEAARVLGFVTPFGSAPPDFEALTVVDHADLPALLSLGWTMNGTTAPFLSMGTDGLVLNLANPDIGLRHHLLIGRQIIDLTTLPTNPTVAAAGSRTMFAVWEPGHAEFFSSFDDFIGALTTRLGGGQAALSLFAEGSWDDATTTLAAHRIVVQFNAAN